MLTVSEVQTLSWLSFISMALILNVNQYCKCHVLNEVNCQDCTTTHCKDLKWEGGNFFFVKSFTGLKIEIA